jgi:hypothetical protein
MTIYKYTKVHITSTLCIRKLAFRTSVLSFLFIFLHHFEQEKQKKIKLPTVVSPRCYKLAQLTTPDHI